MPVLIEFPVFNRHHGGNTRGCTSSSIGQVWPYLDFKGKTKGGFRPHFGPLFWQDLWCDCFTTNWLWKKSGVFLITPCTEKEERPRQRWYVLSTWSNQTISEVSLNMMYQLAVSPKIVELIQLVVYNTQLKMWRLGNSISSSPTLRLCSTQWRKRHCCLTKPFKSW